MKSIILLALLCLMGKSYAQNGDNFSSTLIPERYTVEPLNITLEAPVIKQYEAPKEPAQVSTTTQFLNEAFNKPASLNAQAEPTHFDTKTTDAGRYTNSPAYHQTGFDPLANPKEQQQRYETYEHQLRNENVTTILLVAIVVLLLIIIFIIVGRKFIPNNTVIK